MPSVEIKDTKNNVVDSMSLSDKFAVTGKDALLHEAVVNYMANQRQGTHATKTKGLVSGGGKKPWKQKHTGRARSGSSRSPLWRGGGTIFGPQPRDYSYEMPKTARRMALYAAVSRKIADGELTVIDSVKMEKPRTKEMAGVLRNMGIGKQSALIVLGEADGNVMLSARNIPGLSIVLAKDLNVYDIVAHSRVLATRAAMSVLEERPL
ncbi:MAG: 50S ribosomal protein L4 [Nitrospiraceae bacterium]|nr:50S ribosomal protein L4 [Nitrospiraceae bacterium]